MPNNYALIFAGGTGQRMNSTTRPKQFLELYGKPIIVYTLEQFQHHNQIDGIIVVCLESWIPYLNQLLERYHLTKVAKVIPGGETGQESIYNGVVILHDLFPSNSLVLVHDGVRPLIDADTITRCIACACKNGSAVTVTPAIETIIECDDDKVATIIPRNSCCNAKAPQCFQLQALYEAHQQSRQDGLLDFIDTVSLMHHYGTKIFTIKGSPENIKITTPTDFYTFRAIVDKRENSQIFGL